MEWGAYLCFGVGPSPASSPDGDLERLSGRLQAALKQQGLSKFSSTVAIQFVSSRLQSANGSKMKHAIQYLLGLVNRVPRPLDFPGWELRQRSTHRCPQLVPGLRGTPFWDTADLPWVRALEDSYPDIRREFFALRSAQEGGGFQNYRSPRPLESTAAGEVEGDSEAPVSPGLEATDKGQWNVCYFYLHGMDFGDNLSRCPMTRRAIEAVPRHYHHALFSSLAPDTHVKPHCGPTNKKLRCHLPIFVPPSSAVPGSSSTADDPEAPDGAWLRVGGEFRALQEGKCVVFDDSFEHEAANPSLQQPRAVLIIDVWHPDLSDEEVKFFDFVNNAQIKAAKAISGAIAKARAEGGAEGAEEVAAAGEDFFQLISAAREKGIEEEEASHIWPSD
ncbi:hypothetical protein B484DRAFT_453109 [Ochromonadaceae sp. CCMP2298]|nr:hypothetical protein B484DRAFT_453109 [Ochromonadaceae sp. CCMP2298]